MKSERRSPRQYLTRAGSAPDLRALSLALGSLLAVLVVLSGILAAAWYFIAPPINRRTVDLWITIDHVVAVWLVLSLAVAFTTGGWVSSRVRLATPRDGITGGLVIAAFGLALIGVLLVLVYEFWLEPAADFRSVGIALGLVGPDVPPPLATDLYGDSSIQPPEAAIDKVTGAVGFAIALTALLILASVLGGIAGSGSNSSSDFLLE